MAPRTVRSLGSPALILPFALLSILPDALQAQAPQALARGTLSLEFALPEAGGGQFGIWNQVGTSTSIGWQAGVSFAGQDVEDGPSTDNLSISVGPALKEHFSIRDRVAPFYRFGISGSYTRSERTDGEIEEREVQWGVGGSAGIGVDWFPLDQISIGGHTGLQVNYMEGEGRSTFAVGTFLSRLSMRIYF